MRGTFQGVAAAALVATLSWTEIALGDGSGDPAAVKNEDGKYFDKDGNPTYKIQADGTVDWYTYSGYRRYNAECIRCHGPDGSGSSYAPALTELAQKAKLQRFPWHRCSRQKGSEYRSGSGYARARRRQKRHVLYRRYLRLSAGACQPCDWSRAARQTRRKTGNRHEKGEFLHGSVAGACAVDRTMVR